MLDTLLSDEVKGVLLDIDDTMYDYEVAHKFAMQQCIIYVREQYDWNEAHFLEFFEGAKKKVKSRVPLQAASHSRILYFQNLSELAFGKTDLLFASELANIYYQNFFSQMKIFPDILNFLHACREKKIKVCVVSDLNAEIQIKKLLHLKVGDFIDFLVTSEEAGIEKPHKDIFMLALEKLNMNPEEVVMIGNCEARDAGSVQVGIRFVKYKKETI